MSPAKILLYLPNIVCNTALLLTLFVVVPLKLSGVVTVRATWEILLLIVASTVVLGTAYRLVMDAITGDE